MQSVLVNFVGGLGSQILCAAAYFYLEKLGLKVSANFDYYLIGPRTASETGSIGQRLSHFPYELDFYGLSKEVFSRADIHQEGVKVLEDGTQKWVLGTKGLSESDIKAKFSVPGALVTSLTTQLHGGPADTSRKSSHSKLCVLHIRRGDYVNIGSKLVEWHDLYKLLGTLSSTIDKLYILSDAAVDSSNLDYLRRFCKEVIALDVDGNAMTAHLVMRMADLLVCSNSSFSYTAAKLSLAENQLAIIPNKWFDTTLPDFNILQSSSFSILS